MCYEGVQFCFSTEIENFPLESICFMAKRTLSLTAGLMFGLIPTFQLYCLLIHHLITQILSLPCPMRAYKWRHTITCIGFACIESFGRLNDHRGNKVMFNWSRFCEPIWKIFDITNLQKEISYFIHVRSLKLNWIYSKDLLNIPHKKSKTLK